MAKYQPEQNIKATSSIFSGRGDVHVGTVVYQWKPPKEADHKWEPPKEADHKWEPPKEADHKWEPPKEADHKWEPFSENHGENSSELNNQQSKHDLNDDQIDDSESSDSEIVYTHSFHKS